MTALQPVQAIEFRQAFFLMGAQFTIVGQHHSAGFGHGNTGAMALNQRRRQFFFQQGNLPADRGRRNIQFIGRGPNGALLHGFI